METSNFYDNRGLFFIEGLSSNRYSSQCVHWNCLQLRGDSQRLQLCNLGRHLRLQPLLLLPLGLEQCPSGVQLLSGDQGKPLRLFLVTSPSVRGPIKKVLVGWDLFYLLLPLLCGVSVEPAGKIHHCYVSQELTCRLEQVLTMLVRGMVSR